MGERDFEPSADPPKRRGRAGVRALRAGVGVTVVWATHEGLPGSLVRGRGLDVGHLLEARRDPRPVMVVIPVFNGGEAVSRCLDSVVRWTPGVRVVVIDDASTDIDVMRVIDVWAQSGKVELVRHEDNWGYTRTANQALHLSSSADVVLLNSDTEVGPDWLSRLSWVADGRPNVATVSAVSDNAGAMAVPVPNTSNDWPSHLPWEEVARAATHADLPWSVLTPTGHGFCMLVTRRAIDKLEGFDIARFPRGYGEENDFCMRARAAGLVNLLAPHVLVKHERSQSFGAERGSLQAEGRCRVDELHPTYTADVRKWMVGQPMSDVRQQHANLLTQLTSTTHVLPRRLYVLHQAGGGTPATNLDLMTALESYQESYLVESAGLRRLVLYRVTAGGLLQLAVWQAREPFRVTDGWRQDYAEVMAEWIIRLGIGMVHVRHLINHPLLTLPEVLRRLGVPMVLSTHDFYLVCPSINLLDEQDKYCGGTCTPGAGTCRLPSRFVRDSPPLKHEWVREWQRRVTSVLDSAVAIVATTESASSIFASTYPQLSGQITVIEHGRDIDTGWNPLREGGTRVPGPLRVLAIANWAPHKGTEYVRAMAAHLGAAAEFHVLGQRSELLSDLAVAHGPYARDELPGLLEKIDPDVVALVSIWPETYSHTLSEAWALGIPVLATDIGAVAERIRRYGGGILVPVDDPVAAARRVIQLASDPPALDTLRASVPRGGVRPRQAMAEDYRSLYARIGVGAHVPQLGYVVRGQLGHHPEAAHVRVLARLTSSPAAGHVSGRQVFGEEILRSGLGDLDVLLVQGSALDIEPERLLPILARAGVRLVVDLDEDLAGSSDAGCPSADGTEGAVGEEQSRRMTALLSAADAVIVSTDVLADRVQGSGLSRPVVAHDRLDPRLWLGFVEPASPPPGEEVRVLYTESTTHPPDGDFLREVIESTSKNIGRQVVLECAHPTGAVEGRAADGEWLRRLQVPHAMRDYPDFVRWLRTCQSRWSAAVAPLADTASTAARSDVKLLECAALGLPVVASRVGPYRDASHLARLVENDPASWVEALSAVLTDHQDHMQAARSYVVSHRMLSDEHTWLPAVLGPPTTE